MKYYLITFFIFLYCFLKTAKTQVGRENIYINKGKCIDTDKKACLKRLEWCNNYYSRVDFKVRYAAIAFFITMGNYIIFDSEIKDHTFLQLYFLNWLIVMMFHIYSPPFHTFYII